MAHKKIYDCIEYLSVDAPLDKVEKIEDRQSKAIREYCQAHYVRVVDTRRRCGLSINSVKKQWDRIVNDIRFGRADGVVVSSMLDITKDIPDAFRMVGEVVEAGGIVVTINKGVLTMDIGSIGD